MGDVRVLVTNDDGIDAPGLAALAGVAVAGGFRTTVAAPAVEASGTAASLVAAADDRRVALRRVELAGDLAGVPALAVAAHPGLIALVASKGGFGDPPDVLLSGINRGANIGRAILHSGTVGAVLTASLFGVRGLAVSLDCGDDRAAVHHWGSAAAVAGEVLAILMDLPEGTVLNLNVPNRPFADLGGLRRADLARFGAVQSQVHRLDDDTLRVVTYDHSGAEFGPGTDAAALAAGHPVVSAVRSVDDDPDVDLPWPD